jgi:hypothetical protein
MCGRIAADATSPAADASTTLMTPGNTAWASAAAKIQLRTNVETRLTTESFPVVESGDGRESNHGLGQTPNPTLARQHFDLLYVG